MTVVIKKTPPPKECESCERFIVGRCVIGWREVLPDNCPLPDIIKKNEKRTQQFT